MIDNNENKGLEDLPDLSVNPKAHYQKWGQDLNDAIETLNMLNEQYQSQLKQGPQSVEYKKISKEITAACYKAQIAASQINSVGTYITMYKDNV